MIKDKRVRAAVLIGLLLMLYGRAHASGPLYETFCSTYEPYSWQWFYYGCWYIGQW